MKLPDCPNCQEPGGWFYCFKCHGNGINHHRLDVVGICEICNTIITNTESRESVYGELNYNQFQGTSGGEFDTLMKQAGFVSNNELNAAKRKALPTPPKLIHTRCKNVAH